MLIHLQIENSQPLAGTAASEGSDPRRFDGWLELLTVISELVEHRRGREAWRWRQHYTSGRASAPMEQRFALLNAPTGGNQVAAALP
jgi:hypothetical protein